MLLYCIRTTFKKDQLGGVGCHLQAFSPPIPYIFPLFNSFSGLGKIFMHRSQTLPKTGQIAIPCLVHSLLPNPASCLKQTPFLCVVLPVSSHILYLTLGLRAFI